MCAKREEGMRMLWSHSNKLGAINILFLLPHAHGTVKAKVCCYAHIIVELSTDGIRFILWGLQASKDQPLRNKWHNEDSSTSAWGQMARRAASQASQ